MPKTDVMSSDDDLGAGSVEPRASDADQAIPRAALRRVAERGNNRVERDAFGGAGSLEVRQQVIVPGELIDAGLPGGTLWTRGADGPGDPAPRRSQGAAIDRRAAVRRREEDQATDPGRRGSHPVAGSGVIDDGRSRASCR